MDSCLVAPFYASTSGLKRGTWGYPWMCFTLISPGPLIRNLYPLFLCLTMISFKINVWCDNWLLPFNVNKCCVLHIGRNNPRREYSICGIMLGSVSTHCDLSVTITDDLRWSNHISVITARARQLTYAIQKSFCGCDINILHLLSLHQLY